MNTRKLVLSFALVVFAYDLIAQEAIMPQPSPLAMVRVRYKDAYIKITYSQPHKRGREIFGGLVPYGQVWRLGANEATELTVSRDVMMNDRLLKAGTYSLFAVPEKDKWTIIVNGENGLWGSYNHNPKLDIMQFDIAVETNTLAFEPFTIRADQRNETVNILFLWDNIRTGFPIKFINQ